jgi:hypothetical protein
MAPAVAERGGRVQLSALACRAGDPALAFPRGGAGGLAGRFSAVGLDPALLNGRGRRDRGLGVGD